MIGDLGCSTRQWFHVAVAKADSIGVRRSTVRIYEEIGYSWFSGGVDAGELITQIDELDVDELDVRINSEGGSAYDGLAIANALIRHPAKVTTFVDGLAASAASLVAVAGDEVVISKYGQMMLHNARNGIFGTAEEHRDAAEFLDSLNAAMADLYADRAGGLSADWLAAMGAETWYRADEALTAGLVTKVDQSGKRSDAEEAVAAALARPSAKAQFKYPGRQAAPAPKARETSTKAVAVVDTTRKGGDMPTISVKVAERLGLGDDATDDDVLAKIDELENTVGADDDPAEDGPPPVVETPELASALAVAEKAGMVLIPQARLVRLEEQAAAGVVALDNQVAQAHAGVVDAAVAAGKITPAERGQYMTLMKADPDTTTKLLAGIPAEARVSLTEIGHATEPIDNPTDNDVYKNWSF